MSDTPEVLLDCLAGKLTSFDAIVGYVSQLEMQNAELLGALKDVVEHFRFTDVFERREVIKRADAVIAKAGGK